MKLTIAYMTNRVNPRIHWFFNSLHRECKGDYSEFEVLVVDFHAETLGRRGAFSTLFKGPSEKLRHVTPKPSVWQGPTRLTSKDYFAASNARNTALCLTRTEYIAYVDDLSVMLPGWMDAVVTGYSPNQVKCGAYRKVNSLQVDDGGNVLDFSNSEQGHDHRFKLVNQDVVPCDASWHYGCSLLAPVELYLKINGWPEICDGMGYEDSVTGKVLKNIGVTFCYDRRMMTYEDELAHFEDAPMTRWDPGVSPNDKSHAMLRGNHNAQRFPNYFDGDGIRALRDSVLRGEPFPIARIPEHEWFTGRPLTSL